MQIGPILENSTLSGWMFQRRSRVRILTWTGIRNNSSRSCSQQESCDPIDCQDIVGSVGVYPFDCNLPNISTSLERLLVSRCLRGYTGSSLQNAGLARRKELSPLVPKRVHLPKIAHPLAPRLFALRSR